MRVLILDVDLYKNIGGGQTFYRKVIQDHPAIDFVYFTLSETGEASRPTNSSSVQLGAPPPLQKLPDQPFLPTAHQSALRRAMMFAQAVAGQSFDVIDVPDYNLVGPYLRRALSAHGVGFAGVAHSMHGVLSDSIGRDWATAGAQLLDLKELERAQFSVATVRYAISRRYAREWEMRSATQIHLLDPLTVLQKRDVLPATATNAPPELLVVGRRERRKGNDLAIEIAAWLDHRLHSGLVHIGEAGSAGGGLSSDDILTLMAAARGVPWRVEGPYPPEQLFARYADPVFGLFPVRYDTLNLAAFEALAMGVPVAISSRAGVCDHLDDLGVRYVELDPTRPEAAARAIEGSLRDYARARGRAIEDAKRLQGRFAPLDLRAIYEIAASARSQGAAAPVQPWSGDDIAPPSAHPRGYGRRLARHVWRVARNYEHRHRSRLRTVVPYGLIGSSLHGLAAFRSSLAFSHIDSLARASSGLPESSVAEIDAKIDFLARFDARSSGRALVFGEVARLERQRGEDLRAACYDIRCMRLAGRDVFDRLPHVLNALKAGDFGDVGESLETLYGAPSQPDRLLRLLEERAARLQSASPSIASAAARIEDRRGDTTAAGVARRSNGTPRVSVIVSVYNGGAKLERFLKLLARQTLADGRLELIVVDANSPEDELSRLVKVEPGLAGALAYVRTKERVTIQAAWNVALQLARAPYIAALGVDEALYPSALEKLAAQLDADPKLDWAMASSVVTDVTMDGELVRDKMLYERHDAERDMTFLDTTYVSWVGGLYRRDLHNRFGYYDEAFRAAGDTEFKMRVLPMLKVGFVPETLGVFFDYPDARASASVRAEIEDSLAWYAHRSPAGVRLMLSQHTTAQLLGIIGWCLGRRKCYSQTASTDVELGFAVSALLASRADAPPFALKLMEAFAAARDTLRGYDFATLRVARRALSRDAFASAWARHATALSEICGMPNGFEAFNDNRFQQHSWLWERSH